MARVKAANADLKWMRESSSPTKGEQRKKRVQKLMETTLIGTEVATPKKKMEPDDEDQETEAKKEGPRTADDDEVARQLAGGSDNEGQSQDQIAESVDKKRKRGGEERRGPIHHGPTFYQLSHVPGTNSA